MPAEEFMPLKASPVFQANLQALSHRQPDLCARLVKVELPRLAQVTTGRDGKNVICLGAADGRIVWLGGSSMPSVSVPSAFTKFADRGVSVALPGVGCGHEAGYLANRLSMHSAVFVCERDPVKLGLMLAVAEVSEDISRGRMVFLCGELETELYEFMRKNSGYGFPGQLHPIGDLSDQVIAELTGVLERVSGKVEVFHNQRVKEIADELSGWKPGRGTEKPRVAVLSIDVVGGAVQYAAHLQAAMRNLGWAGAECVPSLPDKCSWVSRLELVREHKPGMVFFINCTPGKLAELLPRDIKVACWFLETASASPTAMIGIDTCEHVVAGSRRGGEVLKSQGARKDSLTILESGVDETVFRPTESADCDRKRFDCDIAVLCDVQDISLKGSNIGLESHERLWARMESLLEKTFAEQNRVDLADLLRKAEKEAAAPLADDDWRKEFTSLVAGRLVKTLAGRTAVRHLLGNPRLGVWGSNWNLHSEVKAVCRGRIPGAKQRNELYNSCRIVVIPYWDAQAVCFIREILAAGCCPLAAKAGKNDYADYPQTGELLSRVPSYSGCRELADKAAELLGSRENRSAIVDPLRRELLAEHTVSRRLIALKDILQG